jgi:hypothetical protein
MINDRPSNFLHTNGYTVRNRTSREPTYVKPASLVIVSVGFILERISLMMMEVDVTDVESQYRRRRRATVL